MERDIYICVKTFQTVYFKYVQLILLQLYSIKLLNESLHSYYLIILYFLRKNCLSEIILFIS